MYSKQAKKVKKLVGSTRDYFSATAGDLKEGASKATAKLLSYTPVPNLFDSNKQFVELSEETKLLAKGVLQPGDIILVKTPTFFHNKIRMVASASYDHWVVVLDASMTTLQVSFPMAKLTKVWPFVNPLREPLVIRPKMSDAQRDNFIAKWLSIVGKKYDYRRLFKLFLKRETYDKKDRVLCSNAIFQAFWQANKDFILPDVDKNYLDFNKSGTFSVDDFFRLGLLMPDKFEIIDSLKPPMGENTQDLDPEVSIDEFQTSSILERYSIYYFLNMLIYIHERADVINMILVSINFLMDLMEKEKSPKKKRSYFETGSTLVQLFMIFNNIEKEGLNPKNKKKLLMIIFNMMFLGVQTKRMKMLKSMTLRLINDNKIQTLTSNFFTNIRDTIKAKL